MGAVWGFVRPLKVFAQPWATMRRMPSRRPFLLFAPGAGAPSTSRWMVAWRKRLETLGDVVAFDYPYMRAGRKSP